MLTFKKLRLKIELRSNTNQRPIDAEARKLKKQMHKIEKHIKKRSTKQKLHVWKDKIHFLKAQIQWNEKKNITTDATEKNR